MMAFLNSIKECFSALFFHYDLCITWLCAWANGLIFWLVVCRFQQSENHSLFGVNGEKHIKTARQRRKRDFLQRVGTGYGYAACQAGFIDLWRNRELPNLRKEVYLDFAGSGLAWKSQKVAAGEDDAIFANPHSGSGPAAARTLREIKQVEQRLLEFFDAGASGGHPGYDIVFTSGTTEALRLVAERFPWNETSTLAFPRAIHTSVLGMREIALASGARFFSKWEASDACSVWEGFNERGPNLMVLPLECNFSGNRLSSKMQSLRQTSSSFLFLDIAKAAATGPVSLRSLNPDFAAVSFYKIWGAPTGIGALFIRRGISPEKLATAPSGKRQYFGGGTVEAVVPSIDYVARRRDAFWSPGGTCHFVGIVSLKYGMDVIDRLGGMMTIRQHVVLLASEFVRRLQGLKHANGAPTVEVYGGWAYAVSKQVGNDWKSLPGPTVAWNIRRSDGTWVGYSEVSKLADLHQIQLRAGCFCNPGACQEFLEWSDAELVRNHQVSGHACGDHNVDLIEGKPTGAIRTSLGKDSTWEDIDTLMIFLERLFVDERAGESTALVRNGVVDDEILTELYVFPIKSCAAQRVSKWKVHVDSGKLYMDREFALVDSSGSALRLQTLPKLALIRPEIQSDSASMLVKAPGMRPLTVSLRDNGNTDQRLATVQVCGKDCDGRRWASAEVSEWFREYLGVECWLVRHHDSNVGSVAFANEKPVLLVSEHAVATINRVLRQQGQPGVSSRHFRPNLVVRATQDEVTHMEDEWKRVNHTQIQWEVQGPCARCSMVDFDPSSGLKQGHTLRALAEYRRRNGQITFGIFLGKPQSSDRLDLRKFVWIGEGETVSCT